MALRPFYVRPPSTFAGPRPQQQKHRARRARRSQPGTASPALLGDGAGRSVHLFAPHRVEPADVNPRTAPTLNRTGLPRWLSDGHARCARFSNGASQMAISRHRSLGPRRTPSHRPNPATMHPRSRHQRAAWAERSSLRQRSRNVQRQWENLHTKPSVPRFSRAIRLQAYKMLRLVPTPRRRACKDQPPRKSRNLRHLPLTAPTG